MRTLFGLNSALCEHVLSRPRGYARILNKPRPISHRLLVLRHVRALNDMVAVGDVGHLNEISGDKQLRLLTESQPSTCASAINMCASSWARARRRNDKHHVIEDRLLQSESNSIPSSVQCCNLLMVVCQLAKSCRSRIEFWCMLLVARQCASAAKRRCSLSYGHVCGPVTQRWGIGTGMVWKQ